MESIAASNWHFLHKTHHRVWFSNASVCGPWRCFQISFFFIFFVIYQVQCLYAKHLLVFMRKWMDVHVFLLIVRLRKCIQCRPSSWIFQRIFQRGFTRFATRVLQRRGSVTVEVIGNYAKICHLSISTMLEIKQIINLYNSHGWSKIIGLVTVSRETVSPALVWSTIFWRWCLKHAGYFIYCVYIVTF